ncbi:MAG: DUF4160 domain-containing protein [Bacteroidota bacterium]
MPVILRVDGYRFYFYTQEHLPIHVHVAKGGAEAKVHLEPTVVVIKNYGFTPREMKKIMKVIRENRNYLIQKWHETFD